MNGQPRILCLYSPFERKDKGLLYFEAEDVLKRVREEGDPFKPVATTEQELPEIARIKPQKKGNTIGNNKVLGQSMPL